MSTPSNAPEKKCDPPIMSTKKRVMLGMEIPTMVLLVGIIISLVYFSKGTEMSTYAKAILVIAFILACGFFGVFNYLFNKVKIVENGCGF